MKAIKFVVAAVACGLFTLSASSQGLIVERSLSLASSLEVATAALEFCKKDGYKVTITVLNGAGRTAVILNDDGAPPHTIEHSLRKAYTAYTARQPSGEYGKRVLANSAGASVLHLSNITIAEGGLPIMAGKDLVGAIGISGAPGGDKDAACGKAGIDRIAKTLAGS